MYTLSDGTIDIETADKLTDPQIVARVKEHFRIDRGVDRRQAAWMRTAKTIVKEPASEPIRNPT